MPRYFAVFFCRDIAGHADVLRASPFSNPGNSDAVCAVSWVGQPPAEPAHVALWSYSLHSAVQKLDKHMADSTLTIVRGALGHHWTTALTSPQPTAIFDQTLGVFSVYEAKLLDRELSLAENVLRTWLFVRDIDANYADLVCARRELFAQRGMTPDTHYIASTGIEGTPTDPAARLTMDAYAVSGLLSEQIEYIRVPEQLCPTSDYGVTFERATAVSYRDRKHVLVSGTASIDAQGQMLHIGDVRAQVDRTLENIAALLHEAGAAVSDLSILIAYVRNASDAETVRQSVRARVGNAPLLVVHGAVCRPEWLVEIEGQAIVTSHNPALPPL